MQGGKQIAKQYLQCFTLFSYILHIHKCWKGVHQIIYQLALGGTFSTDFYLILDVFLFCLHNFFKRQWLFVAKK